MRLALATAFLAPIFCFRSNIYAEVLTPVRALGTSEFGEVEFLGEFSDIFVDDLIDGSGLIDIEETPDSVLDDLHDFDAFWNQGWHSGDFDAGIPGGLDDDGDPFTAPLVAEQILEFDLGGRASVSHMHIWQQNQSGLNSALAPDRGVDEFEVSISTLEDGNDFTSIGVFGLDSEEGKFDVPAQVIELDDPVVARRLRFNIISALSGNEREFVGLAEVRFEGEMIETIDGDFNGDGMLDAIDIDLLSQEVLADTNQRTFDLTGDAAVNEDDRVFWVEGLRNTYFGDANLDGEFNSSDFVVIFQAGEYEDDVDGNSGWATGDWNGDGDFTSSDLVTAFGPAGFELGPRVVQGVPEPATGMLFVAGVIVFTLRSRT